MLNKWVVCKCEGDLSQHLIVVNFLEIVYHFSEVKRFQSVTSCLTNPSKIWSYVYDPCSPLIVLLVDQPRLLQEVFLNIRSEKQDNKTINLKSWSFLTKKHKAFVSGLSPSHGAALLVVHLDEFAKATGVVVVGRLRISKCLKGKTRRRGEIRNKHPLRKTRWRPHSIYHTRRWMMADIF